MKNMNDEQDEIKYPEILVLPKGGIRGFYLLLGAISQLMKDKYTEKVNEIIGCSVGAIIGLLITVGYDINNLVLSDAGIRLLSSMVNNPFLHFGDIFGLKNSQDVKTVLEELIISVMNIVPTLEGLQKYTGISFRAVAYDLKKRKTIIIGPDNFPRMSCVDAVVYSASVANLKRLDEEDGVTMIDGSFGKPCLDDLVDDGKTPILSIHIDEDQEIWEKEITKPSLDFGWDSLEGIFQHYKYLCLLFKIPGMELEKLIRENTSKHVQHLSLTTDIFDPFAIYKDMDVVKFNLFTQGKRCSRLFCESLGINEENKQKESVNEENNELTEVEIEGNKYYCDKVTENIEEVEVEPANLVDDSDKNKNLVTKSDTDINFSLVLQDDVAHNPLEKAALNSFWSTKDA